MTFGRTSAGVCCVLWAVWIFKNQRVGECASMATIIMLSGISTRRRRQALGVPSGHRESSVSAGSLMIRRPVVQLGARVR